MRELVPATTRVAVLVNPAGPAPETTVRHVEAAATVPASLGKTNSNHYQQSHLRSASQSAHAAALLRGRQRNQRNPVACAGCMCAYPVQATRILRSASQVLISNRRGDMPFGEPFGERLQRSSQLTAVQLGHQHGQGIARRSFQATTETRRAPPPITRFQR
jgi:hypothetical protein